MRKLISKIDPRRVRQFYDEIAPRYAATINSYSASRRAESLGQSASGRILEVACGTGAVTRTLRQRGHVVAGDAAFGMALETRRAHAVVSLVFQAEALPFKEACFDTIVCAEALYYMQDPSLFLSEARRSLVPGGRLLLSCLGTAWQIVSRVRISAGRLSILPKTKVPFTSPIVPVSALKGWLHKAGFAVGPIERLMIIPMRKLDGVNRFLERTPVSLLAFTRVLSARKGNQP